MAKSNTEMDVDKCPHLDRDGAATPCEQIAIDRLIAGFEEDRLTAVAALRHVVAWDDDAAHAHMRACLGLIVQYVNCPRNSLIEACDRLTAAAERAEQ